METVTANKTLTLQDVTVTAAGNIRVGRHLLIATDDAVLTSEMQYESFKAGEQLPQDVLELLKTTNPQNAHPSGQLTGK